ncbi:hypothetical protein EHQ81_16065 [Leptospira selangorensis]|uniref:Uncharacterized protein n=1 Tax=Leptospira selangorensis TaxID=2484982 RepID=A0A5F2C484_9LEPT|nr:hypothetical protein [Leptospira selangorensis]TGM11196.1 hypothetical protein EHQ81_16065 [Leptospira selangorensis]TGM23051.1 hypothetical protein EHQ82_06395 [Leptospira selangorensis]
MSLGSKKAIGSVLAIGFLLQIACVSVYNLTGNCPVSMSYLEKQKETSQLPPCHKTEKPEQKSDSSSNECCPKENSVASLDLSKLLDWEKLGLNKVLVFLFVSELNSPQIVLENVILDDSYIPIPSSHSLSLSTLQVFLI